MDFSMDRFTHHSQGIPVMFWAVRVPGLGMNTLSLKTARRDWMFEPEQFSDTPV